MNKYSYEEVKNMKKGRHLIALLCNDRKNKYVGLAHGKFYPIKIKPKMEFYSFIVCIVVTGVKGEYLSPVGISTEDDWALQEYEYQIKG